MNKKHLLNLLIGEEMKYKHDLLLGRRLAALDPYGYRLSSAVKSIYM